MLARLTEQAVPQPLPTLTQPLRLSGAVAELPTTGVLCTANGSSIAVVEAMVGLGDPAFRRLADPGVTFFELDTGHWPMLSAPRELVDVLFRAVAGKGHRVAAVREQPTHLRPFLMDVEERPRERTGRVDLHLPDADGPRPAVVFVHGGPVPAGARPTPRDWPAFVGYAQYAASLGAVGVTVDHRLHELTAYARAADDIAEAIELVRADPRVDGDRVGLWFLSMRRTPRGRLARGAAVLAAVRGGFVPDSRAAAGLGARRQPVPPGGGGSWCGAAADRADAGGARAP